MLPVRTRQLIASAFKWKTEECCGPICCPKLCFDPQSGICSSTGLLLEGEHASKLRSEAIAHTRRRARVSSSVFP